MKTGDFRQPAVSTFLLLQHMCLVQRLLAKLKISVAQSNFTEKDSNNIKPFFGFPVSPYCRWGTGAHHSQQQELHVLQPQCPEATERLGQIQSRRVQHQVRRLFQRQITAELCYRTWETVSKWKYVCFHTRAYHWRLFSCALLLSQRSKKQVMKTYNIQYGSWIGILSHKYFYLVPYLIYRTT